MKKLSQILALLCVSALAGSSATAAEHPFANEFKIVHKWSLSHAELTDLNQDGKLDVLILERGKGGLGIGRVVWHQNKKNGKKFVEREIDATLMLPHHATVGDVDGDGDLDVVGTGDPHNTTPNGGIQWWENLGKAKIWKNHRIHHNCEAGGVQLGDVDGDGDLDVVYANSKTLAYYENADGKGKKWGERRVIVQGTHGAKLRPFVVMDFDSDGDVDVVGRHNDEFVWWENTDGPWNKKVIRKGGNDIPETLEKVDFNADGKVDLLLASEKRVALFINMGKGNFADEQVVDPVPGRKFTHQASAADIDLDGDVDVVVKQDQDLQWWAYDPDEEEFTKNPITRLGLRAAPLLTGDLTSDGAPEIASVKDGSYGLDIWRNSSKKKKKK